MHCGFVGDTQCIASDKEHHTKAAIVCPPWTLACSRPVNLLMATLEADVVLSDIPHLSISRPHQVTQKKSAWRAQTCSTRTSPGWQAFQLLLLLRQMQLACNWQCGCGSG